MDFEVLKKLIKMVKDEDISGIAIEENGVKYEVKREKGHSQQITTPNHQTPAAPQIHHLPTTPSTSSAPKEEDLIAITSPMVGTFYQSPSPESPAFVKAGDDVEPGKVVCIIEAMKLFNEIESEVKGKIVKILAENGKPVEYGQKLFLVKKA